MGRPWILWFAVFFFASGVLRSVLPADSFPHEIILSVSQAVWLEEREYFDIPEEELLETVLQDREFDGWLAQRARESGITLTQEEEETILSHGNTLKISLTADYLTGKITMNSEELQVFAEKKGWLKARPERFEVFYIFIDATDASTPDEKEYYAQKARQIHKKVTKENFRNMARLWSDVPSAEEGGSLGLISLQERGPTFSEHVRQTEPGSISPPLSTPSGWNILYVRNHIPEEKREFSADELMNMVRKYHAALISEKLRQDTDMLTETWKEVESFLKKSFQEELSWYEDFLLAKHFLRSRIEKKEPGEEALQEMYQNNRDSFRCPPSFKAREMVLSSKNWSTENTHAAWLERRKVRNEARSIREVLLEGKADFRDYAKEYSVASSAENGGCIGWITPPSSALYDRTLAGLQPGEISVPLKTHRGYLLLYLEEKKHSEPLSFEEVKPRVRNLWYARAYNELQENLWNELKAAIIE